MKKYICKIGKHFFKPIRFGLFWKKTRLDYYVKFDPSCKYNLENVDQLDDNKLIGLGYLWSHHNNSARFGWRYDIKQDKIEILAYCYDNKIRINKSIGFCEIGVEYNITLDITNGFYQFYLSKKYYPIGQGIKIPKSHNKKISFLLHPYFGGNEVCPNTMTIYLQKV